MMVKKISRDAFFWESQGACAPRREPFPDALARQQLAVPCTTHSFSSRRATDPTAIASYKLQVRLDEQALRDPQGKALASRRAFRWWLRWIWASGPCWCICCRLSGRRCRSRGGGGDEVESVATRDSSVWLAHQSEGNQAV